MTVDLLIIHILSTGQLGLLTPRVNVKVWSFTIQVGHSTVHVCKAYIHIILHRTIATSQPCGCMQTHSCAQSVHKWLVLQQKSRV